MIDMLRALWARLFGPGSVDGAVASLTRIVADLHNVEEAKTEEGNSLFADAARLEDMGTRAFDEAYRAAGVRAKVAALLS